MFCPQKYNLTKLCGLNFHHLKLVVKWMKICSPVKMVRYKYCACMTTILAPLSIHGSLRTVVMNT